MAKMNERLSALIAVLVLVVRFGASGDTWYVDGSVSASGDGKYGPLTKTMITVFGPIPRALMRGRILS
jgi:hypothetical protein